MQIVTIYETSKGFFLRKEDAYKRCNRDRIYDSCNDGKMYEEVKESYAIATAGKFFKLNEINVK